MIFAYSVHYEQKTVTACTECFLVLLSAEISKGTYDQRDLDRLAKDDGYARCFLRTLKSKGDVDKGADVLNDSFLYRKEIGIWGNVNVYCLILSAL